MEEDELSPDIDGSEGAAKGATEQLKAESLTDELPHSDTTKGAATEDEPAFGLEMATPATLLNPVEEYELPPDIYGGEGAVKLKMELLTNESIPIDAAKEAVREVAPAFGLEETALPVMLSPVEEYELPADTDIDVINDSEGMIEERAIEPEAE
ncbi:MAG: hypothetical protein HQK96_18480, partial [Nitrospirae bacterium]|nr:hypothetical protein [Nitrospirota bacterium]